MPLKAEKPGSANWTRRPAFDICTHKCPACYPLRQKKESATTGPLQPIAAAHFQFKLNCIFNRQWFVSQVGTRFTLDHDGPKFPLIIPGQLVGNYEVAGLVSFSAVMTVFS